MNSGFSNWSDIRVFLAVAEAGSTQAAAGRLGQSQPTVVRRVEALEAALGLTLFERDTKGSRLTGQGRGLLGEARAVGAAIEALEARAADIARPATIRITAFAPNFSDRTSAIIAEFLADNPAIRLQMISSVRPLDLMAGEADVAIRLASRPLHPDIIQRHISTAQFALYVAPCYAKRHGVPASVKDFAGHRFLDFVPEDGVPHLHDWLASRVPAEQIAATISEADLFIAAIRAGRGVGLMNVRRTRLEDPDLIQCFEAPPELDASHLILVAPEAWRRPEVKRFVTFFAPRYSAIYRDPVRLPI